MRSTIEFGKVHDVLDDSARARRSRDSQTVVIASPRDRAVAGQVVAAQDRQWRSAGNATGLEAASAIASIVGFGRSSE